MQTEYNVTFANLIVRFMAIYLLVCLSISPVAARSRQISRRKAEHLALRFIRDSLDLANLHHFQLERKWTLEIEEAWVFFYNPKRYIRTRDLRYLIPGHAPLIVNKFDGRVSSTGVSHTLQYYLDVYHDLARSQVPSGASTSLKK